MENFQNFIKASKVSVWYGKLIDIEGASVIMSSCHQLLLATPILFVIYALQVKYH